MNPAESTEFFQTVLLHLTPDRWPASITGFNHTLSCLGSAIITVANIRPSLIQGLIRFATTVSSSPGSDRSFSQILLNSLTRSCSYSDSFPAEAASFAFLFRGLQNKLFRQDDIVNVARSIANERAFRRSSCWMLSYFAPEIEAADPQLAEKMIEILRKSSQLARFPQIFKTFSENFDRIQDRNWRILREKRDFFGSPSSLIARIIADDVESLRTCAKHPSFSIDSRIPPTPYLPSPALLYSPTLIQIAAFFGSASCFRWLLANGADICAIDHNSRTLSQFAVAGGNIEIIRLCQQYGVDFSGTIHSAIKYHQQDIFEWLIDGCGANESNFNGELPIASSCESDNIYALKKFIAIGIDVNSVSFYRQFTPLHIAVRRGNIGSMHCLLSVPGIDINCQDSSGFTPLGIAAKYGDLESASLLLSHGARQDSARSPVRVAAQGRHTAMVKLLLDADPRAAARDGGDALVMSVIAGCEPVAMSLALDDRVDINHTTSDGSTALFVAAKRGDRRVFSQLISRADAVISFRTESGSTLLHATARDAEMAAAVIGRHTIDINARDTYGETALHKAALAGNLRVVELLLAQPGINMNGVTKCGGTPLHHAIGGRQTAVAELLIGQSPLNVNWRSAHCAAPINLAIHENLIGVVRALCARRDLDVSGDLAVRNGVPPLVVAAHCGSAEATSMLLAHPRMCMENERCGVRAALIVAMKMGFVECVRLLKGKRGTVIRKLPGKGKRLRRRRQNSNAA